MTQPIIYTAYRIAKMIIESEDFGLEIDKDKDGDKIFKLVDDNSANWGDIESDRVTEYNDYIYCSAYGDAEIWKSDKEFYKQIKNFISKFVLINATLMSGNLMNGLKKCLFPIGKMIT